VTPRESASKSIEDAIRDVCLTIDARDHFNLEEPIINKIFVELPIKAKKIYRELEKEMFTALETGTNLQVDFAAALSMKCLQLANGAAYTDADKNWEKIHDAKLDALDEIVAESWGENILVSYTFKTDLKRILEKFQDAKVLDKDPKTIEDWNAGKIPMLLAHPASAGHGLNLQFGGRTLVFFGIDWNLENHLQIIERIGPVRQLQAGFKRNVHIHYILAKDTIDELVLERLTTKKTTQEILLEALKTKKEEN
jgi:SNF2 family DNA or RNA helicase